MLHDIWTDGRKYLHGKFSQSVKYRQSIELRGHHVPIASEMPSSKSELVNAVRNELVHISIILIKLSISLVLSPIKNSFISREKKMVVPSRLIHGAFNFSLLRNFHASVGCVCTIHCAEWIGCCVSANELNMKFTEWIINYGPVLFDTTLCVC